MELSSDACNERLAETLRQIPQEYMPELIEVIDTFRIEVVEKTFEEELKESYRDAKAGKVYPIDTLWDGIEH